MSPAVCGRPLMALFDVKMAHFASRAIFQSYRTTFVMFLLKIDTTLAHCVGLMRECLETQRSASRARALSASAQLPHGQPLHRSSTTFSVTRELLRCVLAVVRARFYNCQPLRCSS